jgi:cell division protein ZipA
VPELTLRDGMVLLGSLLILAVVVDAWRRMRQQQRSRVRVKLATDLPADDPVDDLSHFRELPNGGARVVHRDETRERPEAGDTDAAAATSGHEGPRENTASPVAAAGGRSAPRKAAERRADGKAPQESGRGRQGAAATPGADSSQPPDEADRTEDEDDGMSALAGVRAADDEPANLDWLEDLPATSETLEEAPGELPRQSDTEVIVLHVMARGEPGFRGKDILEILLACDLRFGDMNFFHRHEQQAGRGPIQFSVANMLQPGVFDIDNMESMQTRGLVFFLTLPGPEDMIFAFDCMLETARTVARNLGGELLDESRSVLTQQAVEHSRQQIRELERRLRTRGA